MHRILALLLLALLPPSIPHHASAQPIHLWSDPATWDGIPPTPGDIVTIPHDTTVLLDVSPPPLAGLDIDGALIFADQDLDLENDWIVVSGLLQIGSEDTPFTHRATITLTDSTPGEEIMGMGDKVLGVTGGTLEDTPDWRPGDRIVVASTDFDPYQAEETTIAAIDGNTVTVDTPLAFTHWGEDQTYGDETLSERAEVSLLSRNVVIQGDDTSETDGFGGHLMVMAGTAHTSGVELTRMGQSGLLARYPIHFHLLGDRPGAYVRDSAIHHTYNRCLTIHGTNGVEVANTVAYDAPGHCFFLEDGNETGNTFANNFGILTRTPDPARQLLPSDELPATFWITNPDNTLRGNVAAGSDAFGYWYAFPEHPLGFSQSPANDRTVWPRRTPLREFRDNVAHSNGFRGLNVDDGLTPDGTTETVFYDPHENPIPPSENEEDSAEVTATFSDFTAYKNRERGVWLRGANELLTGAILADNLIGATFASVNTAIEDSLIVGESANLGTPPEWEEPGHDGRALPQPWDPTFPIRGYEFYDGVAATTRVAFAGFHSNEQRQASSLGVLRRDEFPLDPHNAASDLTWLDDSNRVFIDDPIPNSDGEKTAIFRDLTGSVTGHPGATITANHPFLHDPTCQPDPAWNASICFSLYGALTLESLAPSPLLTGPVTLHRPDGTGLWLTGTPGEDDLPRAYFQTSLLTNTPYALQFAALPWQLRLSFTGDQSGDWPLLTIPYSDVSPHVYPGYVPDEESALPEVTSLSDLIGSAGAAWFFDGETLTVKLVLPDGEDSVVVDVCRNEGCG